MCCSTEVEPWNTLAQRLRLDASASCSEVVATASSSSSTAAAVDATIMFLQQEPWQHQQQQSSAPTAAIQRTQARVHACVVRGAG
jgi:hypothetical protein